MWIFSLLFPLVQNAQNILWCDRNLWQVIPEAWHELKWSALACRAGEMWPGKDKNNLNIEETKNYSGFNSSFSLFLKGFKPTFSALYSLLYSCHCLINCNFGLRPRCSLHFIKGVASTLEWRMLVGFLWDTGKRQFQKLCVINEQRYFLLMPLPPTHVWCRTMKVSTDGWEVLTGMSQTLQLWFATPSCLMVTQPHVCSTPQGQSIIHYLLTSTVPLWRRMSPAQNHPQPLCVHWA